MPSNHLILCHSLLLLPSIFPSIRSFPVSWRLMSSVQTIGASASVLLMNVQVWFPLGLTGLISLQSKRFSGVFSNITVQKHQVLGTQPSLWSNSYPYVTTGKIIALTRWTFVGEITSLLFNTLSRLVTAFLLRSKHLLISWLQSLSEVILEPKKIKSVTVSIFPIYLPWSDGTGVIIRMSLKGPLCSIQCCCCLVTKSCLTFLWPRGL